MSIEAMKQALEALESFREISDFTPAQAVHAITALRAAIAEAEKQEPVACVIDGDLYFHHEIDWEDLAYQGHGVELLYTTPPAAQPAERKAGCTLCGHCAATGERITAQRQPLAKEKLEAMAEQHVTNCYFDTLTFARAIEAAHGIKEQA